MPPLIEESNNKKPTWTQIVLSVLASAFGVQSHANYKRDFSQTTVLPFILVGVVLVVLLIISLIVLVSWVT